jgi:hypothetical protein
LLKQSGYDGTITLEVFSPDRNFLAYSRDVLQELWSTAGTKPLNAPTQAASASCCTVEA